MNIRSYSENIPTKCDKTSFLNIWCSSIKVRSTSFVRKVKEADLHVENELDVIRYKEGKTFIE